MRITNIEIEFRINTLISKLIQNCSVYEEDDFVFLSATMPQRVDYAFCYFIFCINWQTLYSTPNRITLYDILVANKAVKSETRCKQFTKAYNSIKNLFEGSFNSSADLTTAKELILNRLTDGLKQIQVNNKFKNKGIHEFFVTIFEKLGSVDYETKDFVSPYITGFSQQHRVITDLYDKFIPAFKVATIFNSDYKSKLDGVEIDNFFALHVLLRHTIPYKIKYEFQPNEAVDSQKIINGLGTRVNITARTKNNGVEVISKDGVFFIPHFSTKQSDYIDMLRQKTSHSANAIAKSLFEKLNMILPILKGNAKPNFSPNILYYDDQFYGIEISKHELRDKQIIEIGSFYPLNSDWQKVKGISQNDYGNIINKSDIPL